MRSRSLRRVVAGALLLAPPAGVACAPGARAPAASSAAPEAGAASPPLVVALVVDQLAAWVLHERRASLPPDGGFARLAREGTYVEELRYGHACTDTAPGHASLFTGTVPREHGIFANVVRGETGGLVPLVVDPRVRVVTDEGATARAGASLARLRAPTVADALRNEYPDATVVSISGKDRGALFGAGRGGMAVWFDAAADAFVTSTAFAPVLPPWVKSHGSPPALRRLRATPWTVAHRHWLESRAEGPDDADGEGNLHGYGVVFPHTVEATTRPAEAFRVSPWIDDAVLRLGLAAVDATPRERPLRFLALSLSGNDYVGHIFGPSSWEAWDLLRHLDASLARFFAALDERYGPQGWSALLTGDHGVLPTPEALATAPRRGCPAADRWERPCGGGQRIDPEAMARALAEVATRTVGEGSWVAGVGDPLVFYSWRAGGLPSIESAKLHGAVVAELLRHPAVESLHYPTQEGCPPLEVESISALVCRSIPPDATGTLFVVPKPGAFFDTMYVPGHGTSHGTPYLYDRAVPLLVRAPGRVAAGAVVREPLPFSSFAHTAATLLGVPPPAGALPGADLTARRP